MRVQDLRHSTLPQVTPASRSRESMTSTHSLPLGGATRAAHRVTSHSGGGGAALLHSSESDLLSDAHVEAAVAVCDDVITPQRGGSTSSPAKVSRSAENLLDHSICDVVNDTPVPTTNRVSRRVTTRGIELRHQTATSSATTSSAEASPSRSVPGTPVRKSTDGTTAATPTAQTAAAAESNAVICDTVDSGDVSNSSQPTTSR